MAHQPAGLDQLPDLDVVAPIRVRVEGFDIDALVVPVSADPGDGELAVPPSPDLVAWYQHGAAPGEGGSAVLAAHVAWDGERGPFFTLETATPGATVAVTLADDSDVLYRVTRVQQVAKADLPREEIFARDGAARLTLVTCGGRFDSDRRHYDDNIVVFAELI